jgi:hypothetical protein
VSLETIKKIANLWINEQRKNFGQVTLTSGAGKRVTFGEISILVDDLILSPQTNETSLSV